VSVPFERHGSVAVTLVAAQPQKQHLTWVQQVNAEDTRSAGARLFCFPGEVMIAWLSWYCLFERCALTCCRAVADAKTHIKSFIKHQVSGALFFALIYRVQFQALNPFCFQEQANDARASAYAARWYQHTVTKAKERYEEASSRKQPFADIALVLHSISPPSFPPQDEERAAAAAAAAKLKGTKHLRLKQHPL
jgi:hypothetical protein